MTTPKIAVAVSGGADSLYALLSLKESGVDVFALHALFLPEWLRSSENAVMLEKLNRQCQHLGTTLHTVDCSQEFEAEVMRPFVASYRGGKTPNPCALCNRKIKFGLLQDKAKELGATSIVTGHYARVEKQDGKAALFAAADSSKDQSYFLALTSTESLAFAAFPLAHERKVKITEYLAQQGLELPQPGESQEICFIPDNDYRKFLQDYAKKEAKPLPPIGPVELPNGTRLKQKHKGLWQYTEGQRRGLGIAWEEPLYVLGKDAARNTLIVGPSSAFGTHSCECSQLNFLLPPPEWGQQKLLAKTRYRQELEEVEVSFSPDYERMKLKFTSAKSSPPSAPGQVAAVYAETGTGLRLLAGGIIL